MTSEYLFLPIKDEEAHYVKSVHETLVSEEQFYNVQNILTGKKRHTISTKQKDDLPVRGFLTCSRCGGRLICDGKKIRTSCYHEDLELMLNDVKRLEGNEKGQSRKNRTLFFEVALKGINSKNLLEDIKAATLCSSISVLTIRVRLK